MHKCYNGREVTALKIVDKIYGEFEIDEVLAALIESNAMQRLKGVHQGGASFLVHENWNVTRYEHSVGVMLLIRQLGGSVEEQIAGLLHLDKVKSGGDILTQLITRERSLVV